MRARRQLLGIVGAVALAAGLAFAFGPPRITLLNAALLRIDYPRSQAAAALAASAGALLLALAFSRRWALAAGGVLAALGIFSALERFSYRLDADEAGLLCRRWRQETSVPWREVSRVESGPRVVVVWGRAETQIRVDTSGFRPEQRAALDRTIARRVRESRPQTSPAP